MTLSFRLRVPLAAILSITFASPRAQQAQAQAEPHPPQQNTTAKKGKKQLEAEAKKLVAEGTALEQEGKFAEAKDRYVDAEAILSTGDALAAIRRINDQQKQQVESLLTEAHRSYDAGKFSDTIQQLQQGLVVQPANPVLHYNLSLGFTKLGDRENAALHLDSAIAALPNGKERGELLERLSSVLMGTAISDPSAEEKNPLSVFNKSYLQDRDLGGSQIASGTLCDQTKSLQSTFAANPAVVFNAAKCAVEDARPEDAAHQLADYLKLAPGALDRSEASLEQQNFLSLASLTGDSGQAVRQRFATAARYLDYRRYDRAIAEYERAAQALPDYPLTQWQLSLLYEASGNVAKAREHLARFQQLEPDASRNSEAASHLSTLENRRAVYDANVAEAQEIIADLLLPSLGIDTEGAKHKAKLTYRQWRWASHRYKETTRATEKLSQPYVERELNLAREDLESATELFPLGAEANELLALISLQGNNWTEAYRSYDAVASQSSPVSFYAQVNSQHDSKVVRAAKVEIGADALRLVYLSSYDPKKQVSLPPSKPAGDDDLGNLVVSATLPPDPDAEAFTIRAADLKGIETDKNFVVLKLQNDKIYLAPLDMLSDVPFEGRASRTFGNEYTRLFVRYLGYEQAKLGKEGMTTGEKFTLGFQIARIGVSVGMSVVTIGAGAPVAYGSSLRMAQFIHALAVYRSVAKGVRAANLTDSATRLTEALQMDAATLERTVNEERRAVGGMEFKIIPTQPDSLKFREKF